MKKITIAVDGYSSCGKSTMAKYLAKTVKYNYIDSGAMYRAVTLYAIKNSLFKGDYPDETALKKQINQIHIDFRHNKTKGKSDTYLNGENVEKEIRSMEVADKVSLIAAIGFVREALVRQQQEMGKNRGIVMDGRDIGTVVFPDAELKIFVTARPEVRARRRLAELTAKGENATFEEVLKNLTKRDRIDATRKDSPLRQADDAAVIDNSDLTIGEQNAIMLNLFSNVKTAYDKGSG
ncbi:MAG: (d)CMP kinase [Dysgonamonadaceae bacterium]|jgi:cytidylate kinase|nr:(d)CMP kinase [Dysgonamonadaceae bacterium]